MASYFAKDTDGFLLADGSSHPAKRIGKRGYAILGFVLGLCGFAACSYAVNLSSNYVHDGNSYISIDWN